MLRTTLLTIAMAFTPVLALALDIGDTLPSAVVEEKGEIILNGEDFSYQSWDSTSMREGIPALVMHLPARMSSQSITDPLSARLEAENFPDDKMQSISVINLGDATFGAGMFIDGETRKNKRAHPEAQIIVDKGNQARKAWGLEKKKVYIMVLDRKGEIIFTHTGPMSEEQIEQVVELINTEIAAI